MNRLARFSTPAGKPPDYIELADQRADRAEARADKLAASNAELLAALIDLHNTFSRPSTTDAPVMQRARAAIAKAQS